MSFRKVRAHGAWRHLGLAAFATALLATPRTARADGGRALLGFDVEAFGVRNLDPTNQYLFGFGGGGFIDAEYNVHPLLGVHVGGGAMFLSRNNSPDTTEWIGGRAGLRFHWGVLIMEHSPNDGWLDVHANVGESGGITRGGFDVGAGYALSPIHNFRIGPFVRYQFGSDPLGQNAQWLLFGLTIGILGDPRSPPAQPTVSPHDHDGDGVLDADDVCPEEPAGAQPDPERRGCPARDSDGDGVLDRFDLCPTTPQGARPDPRRPGCPINDADGDGVVDDHDECPTVPAGPHPDAHRAGCPEPDSDGDGVLDSQDQCPHMPAGAHADPARPGCPADRDQDTIPDPSDACPDQPGAPSRDPARNGCPGLVRIEQQGAEEVIHILRPVFFATGRDVILEASFPVLAAVADAVQASGVRRMRIEGHTDNRGNARHNMELSRRRAESVRAWLVQHGIDASTVEAEGFGPARPIESNDTALGRAANRRVEFHILDFGPGPTAAPAPSSAQPANGTAPAHDAQRQH